MTRSSATSGIELPRPDDAIYDKCITIAGWFALPECASPRVRAILDGVCIGQTEIFFSGKEGVRHYRVLARVAAGIVAPREGLIELLACASEKSEESKIGEVRVRLFPASLRNRHYGDVVAPEREEVLHRGNIYGSGPPVEEPSGEILQLVRDYLSPRSSVVDVGCGAGAYGPGLIAAGHHWLGLEKDPFCWELLARRGLPFRQNGGKAQFPCLAGEFDHAICIEVLEHIAEPGVFVGEISRIIRGRAFFSVPNIEVIPYFSSWGVVPWHLLEADHKSFFTRSSLSKLLGQYFRRVEVFSGGEHPLRSRDGIPLHVHLFAVAEKG